jgi:hypothetical protein
LALLNQRLGQTEMLNEELRRKEEAGKKAYAMLLNTINDIKLGDNEALIKNLQSELLNMKIAKDHEHIVLKTKCDEIMNMVQSSMKKGSYRKFQSRNGSLSRDGDRHQNSAEVSSFNKIISPELDLENLSREPASGIKTPVREKGAVAQEKTRERGSSEEAQQLQEWKDRAERRERKLGTLKEELVSKDKQISSLKKSINELTQKVGVLRNARPLLVVELLATVQWLGKKAGRDPNEGTNSRGDLHKNGKGLLSNSINPSMVSSHYNLHRIESRDLFNQALRGDLIASFEANQSTAILSTNVNKDLQNLFDKNTEEHYSVPPYKPESTRLEETAPRTGNIEKIGHHSNEHSNEAHKYKHLFQNLKQKIFNAIEVKAPDTEEEKVVDLAVPMYSRANTTRTVHSMLGGALSRTAVSDVGSVGRLSDNGDNRSAEKGAQRQESQRTGKEAKRTEYLNSRLSRTKSTSPLLKISSNAIDRSSRVNSNRFNREQKDRVTYATSQLDQSECRVNQTLENENLEETVKLTNRSQSDLASQNNEIVKKKMVVSKIEECSSFPDLEEAPEDFRSTFKHQLLKLPQTFGNAVQGLRLNKVSGAEEASNRFGDHLEEATNRLSSFRHISARDLQDTDRRSQLNQSGRSRAGQPSRKPAEQRPNEPPTETLTEQGPEALEEPVDNREAEQWAFADHSDRQYEGREKTSYRGLLQQVPGLNGEQSRPSSVSLNKKAKTVINQMKLNNERRAEEPIPELGQGHSALQSDSKQGRPLGFTSNYCGLVRHIEINLVEEDTEEPAAEEEQEPKQRGRAHGYGFKSPLDQNLYSSNISKTYSHIAGAEEQKKQRTRDAKLLSNRQICKEAGDTFDISPLQSRCPSQLGGDLDTHKHRFCSPDSLSELGCKSAKSGVGNSKRKGKAASKVNLAERGKLYSKNITAGATQYVPKPICKVLDWNSLERREEANGASNLPAHQQLNLKAVNASRVDQGRSKPYASPLSSCRHKADKDPLRKTTRRGEESLLEAGREGNQSRRRQEEKENESMYRVHDSIAMMNEILADKVGDLQGRLELKEQGAGLERRPLRLY